MASNHQELEITQDVVEQVQKDVQLSSIDHEALDQLQDTYCDLRKELDPITSKLKIRIKELATVEESLQEALDESYDVASPIIRKTKKYLLDASPRKKARIVKSKEKLIEYLGVETFLAVAEVSIKDMEKYLTPQQLDDVLEEIYKNKRTLNYSKA